MKKIISGIAMAAALGYTANAPAELFAELGYEAGGEELAATTTGDSISAGSGIKLAIGSQNQLGDGTDSLRFAAGYLFDTLDAVDGSADSSAITLDATYLMRSGPHQFGVGATLHMSPEYSQTGGGYSSFTIEFDDAVGLVLEYGYRLSDDVVLGGRYTNLTYETNNLSVDAGGVGLFLTAGF